MDRLARTRSQHFVHSPRKVASPLKLRHNSNVNRHPTKRRRLGSNVHTLGRNGAQHVVDLTTDSGSDEENGIPGPSTYNRNGGSIPLNSEAGVQTINRNGRKSGSGLFANGHLGGPVKKDMKGKGKAAPPLPPTEAVTFSSDGSSPRKRKRAQDGSEEDSSSWIEMNEDEAEPEFIAEGDQHLIDDAPAYALHRLRKAELVRLWKVAGMWPSEDEEGVSTMPEDEDDDKGMSKRELVDGLIGARKPAGHAVGSPLSGSPQVNGISEGSHEMRRGGSNNTQSTSWQSSASSNEAKDIEVTPRANPRTRGKGARVRIDAANNGSKSVTRKGQPKGVRERLLKSRSKSMGGPGERDERKARFGEVQSPAHGLLNRRSRRNSTMSSSVYTTTDTSPPATPLNSRQQARKPRRSGVTPKRLGVRKSQVVVDLDDVEDMETVHTDSDEESEEADPTPLIQRLRPRTKSFAASDHQSEADADGEDEATEDEDESSLFSPGPSSRLRSRDNIESDIPMSADGPGARQPDGRSAKTKAKQALANGDAGMDIDDTMVNGHSAPKIVLQKRHTRRNSRLLPSPESTDDEIPDSNATSTLTTPPISNGQISTISEDTETEAMRTTRSGKAFGTWQSRRRRLRQEAMDDPDMDVDEDDEAVESDEEEEDSFEADVDLSGATISSLTRFLRDELVQMCEARGIEVGGTKPQLAKALLEWRDEQISDTKSTTSSQATARPSSSGTKTKKPKANGNANGNGNGNKIIHAIGSNIHKSGQTTPVLLRDHTHANDPATPPPSDDSKKTTGEAELNFDLQELGLEDSVIRPDLLVKLERIGSGGFKDVYVGKYKNRKVAISEFREHLSEMDIRELQLLAEFSHPNIVKFRGICIPEDNSQIPCMLVSELCENGDLFDYIRNVPCPPLKRVLGLMLDIAKGLEYLHNHTPPIIHRDCKSSNILINRAGQAKVGDFGLARVKNSTRSMIRSLVGTVNWQAPELWSPKPQYDYKVDVFSAALVFWEMMSGWTGEKKYPWEGHNEHYIYDAVGQKHRRPSTAGLRKHWGTEPVNLMERMWHQDPKERPTMTDVVTDLEVLYAAA